MNTTPTVLLVFPPAGAGGDGAAAAAWAVEALREGHRLSVLSAQAPDPVSLNDRFATTLCPGDFAHVHAPARRRLLASMVPARRFAAERASVRQAAREIGHGFDVVLSLDGEIDAGRRAIQYIVDGRSSHPLDPAATAPDLAAAARNLTLVSSYWTGVLFRETYGCATMTLYPPAIGAPAPLPWRERDHAIVCAAPHGRADTLREAVEIASAVRQSRGDVTLKIVAAASDRAGAALASSLARSRRDWAEAIVAPGEAAMRELFARTRHGIVAARAESFGTGLASMVASGMLAFAPHDAGAVEILGDDDRLLYESAEDAAAKIVRCVASERLTDHLLSKLAERARALSPGSFVAQLRRVVRDFAADA